MRFHKYIKAVGTGAKGNRDLEENEIIDAINMILNKEATDSQVGAFLVAWRTKLETNDELKAMVKALKTYVKTKKVPDSIELGYSFDGRVRNPFLFPLYENILKEFYSNNPEVKRLNIVISGDLVQPAKKGLTAKDIFDEMKECEYLHFFDRKEYFEKLSDFTQLRHELGLRTAFNTVEKLLNPGLSQYAITTAFHKPYVKKYIEIFNEYYDDIFVIKASEGSPEVFKNGKYWKLIDGEIKDFSFDLSEYGIETPQEYENISKQEALEIINNPDQNTINLAKFNIAILLYLTNRIESLDKAWQKIK